MSQRKLFEEVTETGSDKRPDAQTGLIARQPGARHAIRRWLSLLLLMVVAQTLLGGLTRLTDSGLSITQWNLLLGALPPLGEDAWNQAYAAYQAIPEFQLQNSYMDLADFKSIYWWEWAHRELGRLIGLVWAVGFVIFLARKKIPAGWTRRLFGIGALIGLIGAVGWWMVRSGLSGDMLDVASYRLATHLGLVFVLQALLVWYILSLKRSEAERMAARRAAEKQLRSLASVLMVLAFLQILLGALVAGIDAGRTFVDWPWMAGQFLPPDPFEISPTWRNFFENPGLVQFIHRIVAYTLTLAALWVWWRARRSPHSATASAFTGVAIMVLVQVALGIITVIYAAPLHAAIIHQLGAIFTWVLIIVARHQAAYPVTQSIRG